MRIKHGRFALARTRGRTGSRKGKENSSKPDRGLLVERERAESESQLRKEQEVPLQQREEQDKCVPGEQVSWELLEDADGEAQVAHQEEVRGAKCEASARVRRRDGSVWVGLKETKDPDGRASFEWSKL